MTRIPRLARYRRERGSRHPVAASRRAMDGDGRAGCELSDLVAGHSPWRRAPGHGWRAAGSARWPGQCSRKSGAAVSAVYCRRAWRGKLILSTKLQAREVARLAPLVDIAEVRRGALVVPAAQRELLAIEVALVVVVARGAVGQERRHDRVGSQELHPGVLRLPGDADLVEAVVDHVAVDVRDRLG